MKRKNRILGFVLAFVLLFVNVQPIPSVYAGEQEIRSGKEITVTLRVEGIDKTVVSKREITLPDTYKSLAEYGLEGVSDNGMYTPMHALAQYCENEGVSTDVIRADATGNINSFHGMGGNDSFLMFVINNQYQADDNGMGYLFGSYPLKDGDSIVLYDFVWSATGAYTYFDQEDIQATAEEPFSVKVNAHDGMGGFFDVNATGASLILEDMSGNKVPDSLYTATNADENENAVLTVHKAGEYRLTVERTNQYGQPDVSRAYAMLHVKEEEQLSDEKAVELAVQELLANTEQFQSIEHNVVFPSVGIKGTSITWQSLDEDYLGTDGTLKKRLVGEDKNIILKAMVSKGQISKEAEIKGTIKGYYLKALSVTSGTIKFDPAVKAYTVYVGKDTEKVTVSVNAGADAVMAKIDGSFIFGNTEVTGEKEIALKENETVIKIEAQFPKSGGMQIAATVTIRKSTPGEPLPELPAAWPQHYGKADNNAVTDKKSAIEQAELLWKIPGEAVNEWVNYAGHPILVNGNLYAARGDKLQIIDSKTGNIIKTAQLAQKTGYYSYITYGDGKIFVPLTNGQVQCFHAGTLESLFITEVPGNGWQALSSIFYQNGMIYTGFTTGSGNEGAFSAYSTLDTNAEEMLEEIKPEWSVDTGKGYYGSGAVSVNDGKHLVFAGDAGIVTVVDAATGKEMSRTALAGAVRTAIVSADGYLWLAAKSTGWGDTSGNRLYKLAVDEEGIVSKVKETGLPDITGSTPVIANGRVIIGGGSWEKGFLQVYDMDLKLLAETETKSEVKSPTATTAYEDLYVYFTQNVTPGGVYAAKITGDNNITVSMLHRPEAEQENYSMSNVLVDENGTLYYANDSGYLFAIKEGEHPVKPIPDPKPTPSEKPDPKPSPKPNPKPSLKPDASSGNEESKTQEREHPIVKVIKENAVAGNDSVTVYEVPKVIEAEVFAELLKHPKMTLILDCGAYTISIRGSDIINDKAVLSTVIEQVEGSISREVGEKLGSFEQYRLLQQGELPGRITIVLKISEALKEAKTLYLYDAKQMESADRAVINAGYAMFTLDNPHDFILAEKDIRALGEAEAAEQEATVVQEQTEGRRTANVIPYIVIGVLLVLIVFIQVILVGKRRKGKNEKK